MKQIFFIILALSLACSCTQRETVITGKLSANGNRVIYSNPINGNSFDGFRDTIYTDKDGRFELRRELNQKRDYSIEQSLYIYEAARALLVSLIIAI